MRPRLLIIRRIPPHPHFHWRLTMFIRTTLAAAAAAIALIAMPGCAVTRGQETTGAYVDDSAITAAVKSKFVGNKDVDASSIAVETLNGTVMRSGCPVRSRTHKPRARTQR